MKSCNIIVGSRGGATLAGQIEKASLRQRHLSKTLNKKKKKSHGSLQCEPVGREVKGPGHT